MPIRRQLVMGPTTRSNTLNGTAMRCCVLHCNHMHWHPTQCTHMRKPCDDMWRGATLYNTVRCHARQYIHCDRCLRACMHTWRIHRERGPEPHTPNIYHACTGLHMTNLIEINSTKDTVQVHSKHMARTVQQLSYTQNPAL